MKIPEPRKLSSGNYFIQLRLNGVSVPVTADTVKECKQQAQLIKAEHLAGRKTIKRSSAKTLNEAIDSYINSRSNALSPSTIRGYRTIQKCYLQDQMKKKLKDIKNWQGVINAEAERLSPKTVKNTWRFICSVLRENGIEAPKILLPQIPPKERPWLDYEQIKTFLKAINGEDCELAALLALHSLRRSEIIGLTTKSINTANNTITIAGSKVLDEHGDLIKKNTNKNNSSTRTIPIMIPRLLEVYTASEHDDGDLMHCNPNTMYKQINRICERAGLPEVGVHGLRHSFASLGYHLKISEMDIMWMGGWSNPDTVHKIYTHLAEKDKLTAQNKMAEFYKALS